VFLKYTFWDSGIMPGILFHSADAREIVKMNGDNLWDIRALHALMIMELVNLNRDKQIFYRFLGFTDGGSLRGRRDQITRWLSTYSR